MTNRKTAVFTALLCLNLLCTALLAAFVLAPRREESGAIGFTDTANGQYVLYIGTNDKDTYEQIIPTDEAIEIVNAVCEKYVGGYTMSGAKGGWVDEAGIFTQENTLVYTFTGVDEETLTPLMDEVLARLNQNAILVERRDVSSSYYTGSGAE